MISGAEGGSLRGLGELLRPTGVLITLESPGGTQESVTKSLLPTLEAAGLDTTSAELSSLAPGAVLRFPATPVYQSICIITGTQQENFASPLIEQFKSELASRSVAVHTRTIGQPVPADDTLVFFMDLAGPYVHGVTEAEFVPFMGLLSEHNPPMVWVTTSSSKDPRASMIYGLARTLRSEHKADLTVVEVDSEHDDVAGGSSSQLLVRIVQGLPQRRFNDHNFSPDFEFALVGDSIQVPRFHWTTPQQELSHCAEQRARESYARLVPKKPHQADSLRWVNYPSQCLHPGEVRVEVRASAVNKEDIDALDSTVNTSSLRLGHEGTGVVTQVGDNVQGNIRVGDKVMFCSEGAIASDVDVSPARCLRFDDSTTPFEIAASLPLACVTTYLAVVELGRIPKHAVSLFFPPFSSRVKLLDLLSCADHLCISRLLSFRSSGAMCVLPLFSS